MHLTENNFIKNLVCIFFLTILFPLNSYGKNKLEEIRHELINGETRVEIVLDEGLGSPVTDYKDSKGLVLILENVVVDPPRWKFLIGDKEVLEEILISQQNQKNAKILFHIKNPGKPIPYTITTSNDSKTITVSLKHPVENSHIPVKLAAKPAEKEKRTQEPQKSSETLPQYQPPKAPMPPDTMSLLLRTASALALVLGLIFLAAFVVKKFFPDVLKNMDRNKNFRIIEKISIGQRKQIVLVKIYGKKLLLGITPNQINFLVELEEENELEGERVEEVKENNESEREKFEEVKEDKRLENILIKAQEKEPFTTHLSSLAKEKGKYKKEEGADNVTVGQALSNLDKENKIAKIGSHNKSVENALSVLQNKIKQFNKKD